MAFISKITPLGSSSSYDLRAAKLGSTTIGNEITGFYLNEGTATALNIDRYHYDGTETCMTYPWHKVATYTITSAYADAVIRFLVTSGEDVTKTGILSLRVRSDGNSIYEGSQIVWETVSSSIDLNNFVLVKVSDTIVEFWCKMKARYAGWIFKIIESTGHNRAVGGRSLGWTLNDSISGNGSANYSSGTVIVSTMMSIKIISALPSHTHPQDNNFIYHGNEINMVPTLTANMDLNINYRQTGGNNTGGFTIAKTLIRNGAGGYSALYAGDIYANGWLRSIGATGWYSETYGGGWYMTDTTWIRNYNSKRIYLNAECVVGGNNPYGSFRAVAGNFGAFFRNDGSDTYILLTASGDVYGSWNGLRPFRINNTSGYTYFTRGYGAVWNDYAEFRITKQEIEPGRCIKEIGDDTLELTTKRLEKGCEIVSDTYGFAIGESEIAKTPTAASGRVLAYPYEDREIFRQHIGDPVCSGPNGTVSIMTEEEEMRYPSRIIGTVSSIPDYEEWNTGNKENYQPIKVNGRIWIRIK